VHLKVADLDRALAFYCGVLGFQLTQRPDTVVLGLGFPTLIPENGIVSMTVANAKGMLVSGIIFDAGATNSPVLLQVGSGHPHRPARGRLLTPS
jgi:catechol 2,3-dioxygenase-like lactoylglutathione lyase family enzyme